MNNTGFFFCGLLVGVVVSAAFGLDFFPSIGTEPGAGAIVSVVTVEPDGAPSQLAPTDQTQLVANLDAASRMVTSLEEKLAATESALQAKQGEVTALEAQLKTSTPGEAQAALHLARIELAQEGQRAKRLTADLELSHRETNNLLKQFFASKRSAEDAILVSEYFATSAPEKFKGDLVDHLLQTNRDVITSLSPVTSLLSDSRTGLSGLLTPVSATTGVSGPAAAVLREDQRENLEPEPARKNDASDPTPNTIPTTPEGKRAVQLPPPPGE